jgi:hypothetical protein
MKRDKSKLNFFVFLFQNPKYSSTLHLKASMTMKSLAVFFILLAFCSTVGVMAWPNEFLPSDLQQGFAPGMAPELRGLWLGDEKYKNEDGSISPYCSRAIFYPESWLTWESTAESTCANAGAEPKSKTLGTNWTIEIPAYIYRFRQKKCLPMNKCTENITQDHDPTDRDKFRTWEVRAKACGVHLKDDQLTNNTYTCEQYQVNLIRNRQGRQLLVVVLSYHFFEGGFDNFECPSRPSFLAANIANPGDGSARFVLQLPFDDPTNATQFDDPCTWDCFNDAQNANFNCSSRRAMLL